MNGDYDLNMAPWIKEVHRLYHLEFIKTYASDTVVSFAVNNLNFDWRLFIRPITDLAWFAIGGTLIICFISILLSYNFKANESFRVSVTITFYFFVIINIYYGGAMTMFFTTSPTTNFNSMEDILNAYPDWTLKITAGVEIHFETRVREGDKLIAEYWQRVKDNPQFYKFNSMKEAVIEMETPNVAVYTQEIPLKGYMNNNPNNELNIHQIKASKTEGFFINALNYPLTDIFDKQLTLMRQIGITDKIYLKWSGKEVGKKADTSQLTVFGFSQMSLIFFAFLLALCLAIFILDWK